MPCSSEFEMNEAKSRRKDNVVCVSELGMKAVNKCRMGQSYVHEKKSCNGR